ncbi:MAG: hypothetical protein IJ272_06115 [Clostridia bacterium]|nr:hypothetical protein [Clostridia bacterium]
MQNVSLPIKFNLMENKKSNLQKCELWIMREGLNSNGSSFDLSGMDKASESLKNIPILAYIKKGEDGEPDFDEHNMEYRFETDDEGNLCLKEHYLEVPIGVIPESNNYRLEKVNGHKWVVVDGYIWKSYSNEGYEILKRDEEKSVSMEISVNRGEFSKNIYNILDYTYLGVTVLGSDVAPGISGAKIKMDFSTNDNTEFFNAVKELNKMLKEELQSEVKQVDNITLEFEETKKKKKADDDSRKCGRSVEEVEVLEETETEETIEQVEEIIDTEKEVEAIEEPEIVEEVEEVVEEESVEEFVKEETETVEETVEEVEETEEIVEEEPEIKETEEFSANIGNVVGYVQEAIAKVTYEEEFLGEYYTSPKFYFEDLLLDTNIAILFDAESWKYVGVNYTLDGDNVLVDFDSAKEYIPTWKEREVGNQSGYGVISAYKKQCEDRFNSIVERFKSENEELKKFKQEVEVGLLKEELINIASEFAALKEEETQVVIDKVLNKEIDKQDFKKELFALVGMKTMENTQIFSAKGTKFKVPVHNEDNDPYGGLIKK